MRPRVSSLGQFSDIFFNVVESEIASSNIVVCILREIKLDAKRAFMKCLIRVRNDPVTSRTLRERNDYRQNEKLFLYDNKYILLTPAPSFSTLESLGNFEMAFMTVGENAYKGSRTCSSFSSPERSFAICC